MIENLSMGIYFVTVTDANGCEVEASVNIMMTGFAEIASMENIDVFPNPTSGELTILANFSSAEELQIQIFNVIGQPVVNQSFTGTNLNLQLNLAEQAAGTYFLKMQSKNGMISRKLVLVR